MVDHQNGFTLVETLVVLVILAVLAAVSLPVMNGYIREAKDKRDLAEAVAVSTAVQTLMMETYQKGKFDPMDFSELVSTYPIGSDKNPLTSILQGSFTSGSKIVEFGVNTKTMKFTYFSYRINKKVIYIDYKSGKVTIK